MKKSLFENKKNACLIPMAFYMRTFKLDYEMVMHEHQYSEIMYAVDNSFYVTFAFPNKETVQVKVSEGQLIFISGYVSHRLEVKTECKILNLEMGESVSDYELNTIELLQKSELYNLFCADFKYYTVINDNDNVLQTLRKLHAAIEKDESDYSSFIQMQGLFLQLFIEIPRCYFSTVSNAKSLYIQKTLNIIHNNLSGELRSKKIAQSLHISESYFHRLFRLNMGMTFTEYINKLRVDLAKTLLTQSSGSIPMVCAEAGFGTRQNFHKIFFAETKMSPSAFRKEFFGKEYARMMPLYIQTESNDNSNQN